MASDVDICNLALSHLGDEATVITIDPPENSTQAEYCARFYPIARDSLLEMHPWRFATKRVALAQNVTAPSTWQYSYAQPNDLVKHIAILAPDAPNDLSGEFFLGDPPFNLPNQGTGAYTQQTYATESAEDGSLIILTNQENAHLLYIYRCVDTTRYSPLFVDALSRLLASYLAGPVLKGEAGRAEAKEQLKTFLLVYRSAAASDATQRRVKPLQSVSWIAGR